MQPTSCRMRARIRLDFGGVIDERRQFGGGG
jgi:hypothetical protein